MTFPPRSPQQWETWWAEFKKRNGLTPERLAEMAIPKPPADAPPPPKPHSDVETDEEGTK
jgi:hypothetical protein